MAKLLGLTENPPEGITAGPISEDNFFEWEALIMGPPDTIYEGGVFSARLTFPADYPHHPPKMVFTTPMWHPNLYSSGEVCISILHSGDDPTQYEKSEERWSPIQSVEKILLSVMSMLSVFTFIVLELPLVGQALTISWLPEPNCESPANLEAAKMWRENPELFRSKVRETVAASLGL